jgi:hypothetical protein
MHARHGEFRNANQLARDSLVFGRKHRLAMLQTVHLWKNFLPWVKQTQRPCFAMSFVLIKRDFHRSRESGIEFPICAKTPILSGFLMCLSIRAVARGDVARRRSAQ